MPAAQRGDMTTTATVQFLAIPSGPNRHHHFFVPTPAPVAASVQTVGSGDVSPGNPAQEFIASSPTQLWKFVFWSWDSEVSTQRTMTLPTVPSSQAKTFTAWYRPWPGPPGTGGGEVGLETWAFSRNAGGFITVVPIDSVTPPGLWGADPTDAMVVTNNSEAWVTAKETIGAEAFERWIVTPFGVEATLETTSRTFHGTQGEDALCIAIFGPSSVNVRVPPIDVAGGLEPHLPWFADPVPFDTLRLRGLLEDILGKAGVVRPPQPGLRDELSAVLDRAKSLPGHEVQQWLGTVRSRLTRLAEAERTLLEQLKGK